MDDNDPAEGLVKVYTEAVVAKNKVEQLLEELKTIVNDVEIILAPLKGFPRVTEKMIMRQGQGVPWDLVRAQAICNTMSSIEKVACAIADHTNTKVVTVNNRFKRPTPNGWRDVALYFQIRKPECASIVVELQLLHRKLYVARVGMNADDAYHKERFAGELLTYFNQQIVVSTPNSVAEEVLAIKQDQQKRSA